jgi:hypothetical protein
MSATRIIDLPAINRSVTLAAYVQAIRLAKANPDTTFKHGLTAWWPCTGREIMRQFRAGMNERINQRVPYRLRGMQP